LYAFLSFLPHLGFNIHLDKPCRWTWDKGVIWGNSGVLVRTVAVQNRHQTRCQRPLRHRRRMHPAPPERIGPSRPLEWKGPLNGLRHGGEREVLPVPEFHLPLTLSDNWKKIAYPPPPPPPPPPPAPRDSISGMSRKRNIHA
jgi:hypothetical protein